MAIIALGRPRGNTQFRKGLAYFEGAIRGTKPHLGTLSAGVTWSQLAENILTREARGSMLKEIGPAKRANA